MAHDADKRREARKRYVYERQALPTIAIAITVAEATLRRWKREAARGGDDWDQARGANAIAGGGLDNLIIEVVQDYVTMHQATIEDLRNDPDVAAADKARILASLADAFTKTVNAAGRVSPKISELGVAMDVLKRLVEFTSRHHPALAPQLLDMLEPFGAQLSEVYG